MPVLQVMKEQWGTGRKSSMRLGAIILPNDSAVLRGGEVEWHRGGRRLCERQPRCTAQGRQVPGDTRHSTAPRLSRTLAFPAHHLRTHFSSRWVAVVVLAKERRHS